MNPYHKFFAWGIWLFVAGLSFWLSVKMDRADAGALLAYCAISFGFNMACIGFIYNSRYARELYQKVSNNKRRIYKVRKYFFASGVTSMVAVSLIIYQPILREIALCIAKTIFNNDGAEVIDMLWSAAVYATVSANILLMLILLDFVLTGMVKNARDHAPSEQSGEQR